MLVLFLRLRPGSPSKPMLGLLSWLGLGRLESTDIVSAPGKRRGRESSPRGPPAAPSREPQPRPTCIVEPLLQEGLEFAHVLEAQIEGLEAGNGRLAEVVAIEFAHGQAHVTLIQWGRDPAKVRAGPSASGPRPHSPSTGPTPRPAPRVAPDLREAQLDAALLEGAGKLLQLFQITGLLGVGWWFQAFGGLRV
jgi:hypothetical protein